ncbi:glutathione S-transferase [Erwinia tracheiphila PSU-1]|nr:glutathione S-transferase [Erwinia tracheiphila PSU-1]
MIGPEEIWYDSHIIAAYPEQLHPGPTLLPQEKQAALADGVGDAAVLLREQMRPAETQSETQQQRQRDKIQRGLDALEQEARAGLHLNCQDINLADIATACVINYMCFRQIIIPDWQDGRPTLVEKMLKRASFVQTTPESA